jgi:hypothetical protein
MSKKPVEFAAFAVPMVRAESTRKRAKQLLEGRKRLFVEVSHIVHQHIKARALPFSSTKDYILWVLDNRESAAKKSENPFPSAAKQRRIILEMTDAEAERLLERAKPWKTFREFVLRCLEADGIRMR